MSKKTFGFVLGVLLVVLLLVAGCKPAEEAKPAAPAKPKEPYKIGAVLSVTGINAPLGDPEKKTLEMEVEKINKKGGIDGHKIELVVEDDASLPANAIAAVNKLIQQDKVIAVIGSSGSGPTKAIRPIVSAAGIPLLMLAAANELTEGDIKWVFRTPQKDALAVAKALGYIQKNLKAKKVAILYDSNPFGTSGANEIIKEAPDLGLTVVATEKYESTATDVTTQLTNIKAASPDVVVVWGTNPVPAIAAKTMKQLGMTQPYVGSHGIANKKFIELGGDAVEGVVFPSGKILVPASMSKDSSQRKVIDGFIKDYKAKYGADPNTFAGHAWDGIHLLEKALAKSGADKNKLRSELEKIKNFAGTGGIFNYSATNHDGLTTSDMIIIEIKGGKWTLKAK